VNIVNYLSEKARKLTPYVAGLQPKNLGFIKLNTNENPYPPSPKVTEALKNADIAKLKLYPNSDSSALCEAISERLGVKPENVFCGNGSDEVLALTFQAFFSGKDNIIMPEISYGFYPVWSEIYDVTAKPVPMGEGFIINTRDYKSGNGVTLANPNTPTGIALNIEEVEDIVKNNPDGVVVIDEAYIDFAKATSAIGLSKKYSNLLVVRTFSKSYSLAGLRVGFAVGNNELIDALQRVKNAFNSYPLDILAQTGAKAAIGDIDYFEETRKRIIETRMKTVDNLNELGYDVLDSQANFIFMHAENAKELYEYLFSDKILVRYWDKPRIDEFLRVTIGTDIEMEAFIQCVKQFLKEKPMKQQ